MRLIRVDRQDYTDSVGQHVKTNDIDVLTTSFGVNYSTSITTKEQTWVPKAHLTLTYDILSDNSTATVNVIDGVYTIKGKRLNRFGIDAGVGAEITVGDWNFSAGYNLGMRHNYLNHTGMLKAKYSF